MLLSKFIVKYIESKKIHNVFMLSGTGSIYLDDAFAKSKKIKHICARHEAAAVMMANAVSKLTVKPSVVIATTGPGGTNAIGGLAESWVDSIPVLIISGQTNTNHLSLKNRSFGLQGFNILNNIKNLTKYSAIVKNPNEIKYHLDKAIYYATEGRPGPAWLDIPMDIQSSEINEKYLKKFNVIRKKNKFNVNKFKKLQKLISNSNFPIFLFGQGIRLSNSIKDFKKVLDKFKIPAICTRMGLDILDYKNKSFFGLAGIRGHKFSKNILKKADLIISVGSSLPHTVIGKDLKNLSNKVKIIANDIDKFEITKKNLPKINLVLENDCKSFIKKLLRTKISSTKLKDFNTWRNECIKIKQLNPTLEKRFIKNPINSYYLIDCLNKLVKKNSIFVNDAGSANYVSSQALQLKKNQREITSGAFYSMGVAVPMSIGAAAAFRNKRQVIVITGDGSIELNIQELRTISLNNLNVKIFVINNGGYASIRKSQDDINSGDEYIDDTSVLNFMNIAKAFKLKYKRISKFENLKKNILSVIKNQSPYLVEVICDSNQKIIETAGTK